MKPADLRRWVSRLRAKLRKTTARERELERKIDALEAAHARGDIRQTTVLADLRRKRAAALKVMLQVRRAISAGVNRLPLPPDAPASGPGTREPGGG